MPIMIRFHVKHTTAFSLVIFFKRDGNNKTKTYHAYQIQRDDNIDT